MSVIIWIVKELCYIVVEDSLKLFLRLGIRIIVLEIERKVLVCICSTNNSSKVITLRYTSLRRVKIAYTFFLEIEMSKN